MEEMGDGDQVGNYESAIHPSINPGSHGWYGARFL